MAGENRGGTFRAARGIPPAVHGSKEFVAGMERGAPASEASGERRDGPLACYRAFAGGRHGEIRAGRAAGDEALRGFRESESRSAFWKSRGTQDNARGGGTARDRRRIALQSAAEGRAEIPAGPGYPGGLERSGMGVACPGGTLSPGERAASEG